MYATTRSPVRTFGAAALIGGALFAAAALPANAADGTSGPGIKFWAEGALKPGATIDVYADCGYNKNGAAVTTASVTGFAGSTTELKPMASKGILGGTMTVPKTYTQSTAVLQLTCDNMGTGTFTVRAAAPAPTKVLPKGGAQTGGGPATANEGTSTAVVLGGVGVAGLVGAGAFALRRRAESH